MNFCLKTSILFLLFISYLSKAYEFNFRQVGGEFNDPWRLAFLDNDKFILSELSGKLKLVSLETGDVLYEIEGVPCLLYTSDAADE